MKIYKTYRFRMYPERFDQEKINSFLGTKRFIYNYYLNEKEKNNNLTLKEMKKSLMLLQKEKPWLKEVDGSILRTTLDDLDKSYQRYYQKIAEKPKFKKYNNKQSYRTPYIRATYNTKKYQNIKIDLERKIIKLPKIEEIKIRGYRNLNKFPYKIINATVIKEVRKYYVSLLVEEEINIKNKLLNHIVGVDLGVKDLITTSDGYKFKKLEKNNYFRK